MDRRAFLMIEVCLGVSFCLHLAAAAENPAGLVESARRGNIEEVRHLLAAGADVNARDQGYTALMAASGEGHTEVVKLLLEAKAEPNAKTDTGMDALGAACGQGHAEVVKLLLKAGASVNSGEEAGFALGNHFGNLVGFTPLMAASVGGHAEVVRLLLAAKADPNARLTLNSGQAHSGSVSVGAVQMASPEGRINVTALQLATAKGHKDIVTLLRAAGARDISQYILRDGNLIPAAR